jgi:ABC-type ATPase involved in cell division
MSRPETWTRERLGEIMELFERANAQGTTLFVATHDQNLVQKHGKRVVAIRALAR